jgi:hypothetical protein
LGSRDLVWRQRPSVSETQPHEEEVTETRLNVPKSIYETIKELSVKIERFYEGIDLTGLPKACFEN